MAEQKNSSILGRGNREGSALVRQWFDELNELAENDGQAAYVFVMGSIGEILQVFDIPVVFPEVNALQTAVRRVSHEYLGEAEDYGYSPDSCGYVKADIGIQLREGEYPMGRVPKPALSVHTNACNIYLKWAEIWQRMYDIPIFTMDVPGTRTAGSQSWPGDRKFVNDHKYVTAQVKELFALCEKVSGVQFDIDKLREILGYANRMNQGWKRVLELNQNRPSLFNALTDGTVFLGITNVYRGTEIGAKYFEDLVEEMEYKADEGIGTDCEEKYRLLFVGVPCYPIFRRFNEMFSNWGGTFISSTYLWFASGGNNFGFQYDLNNPIESLAEGILISVRDAMDSMFFQDQVLVKMVDSFQADGIVYHPVKSCRTVSTGLLDNRRAVMAARDIPSLFIESDMVDRRAISEAQLKNRIDAFFEGLASRRERS
ncbi:MAG: 2-hydroxyacyl-CoA dehydratase [SAR324 cluster bacterium]|nr:2-hydroxyacyl-CoA dehydratase [SAR324 cluster bacterium]